MSNPDLSYASAERRIELLTLILGAAGGVFAAAFWGWRTGAGVGVGALLMWLNFRWLKQGVAVLVALSVEQGESEKSRVPPGTYMKSLGRFGLLLLAVYVILSRSLLPAVALLSGLFALVAAVMLEMLFELVRGVSGTQTHM